MLEPKNNQPLLSVKNLRTSFFRKGVELPVVDDISFDVDAGETLAIVGESGSGKSVTSLSIMRLIPSPGGRIMGGDILFNGVDLTMIPEKAMYSVRGEQIAMIFQDPMSSLNPVMTIGEQICESLRYHKGLSKGNATHKAIEILRTVGFARAADIIYEYPHQLSGGMRQRVMIAMAMSCNPQLLIADEPTTALDVTVQAQILDLMQNLKKQFNSAIILITHDLGVVAELADKVLVMYAGKVVERALVRELFDNPQHPYTKGLMQSVPKLDQDEERLFSIGGNVPTPDNFPKGCRFSTRCPEAMPRCHHEQPELIDISPGHQSRCFLHEAR